MEIPLMTLPCLNVRLELYTDHVTLRPIGAWAWMARLVERTIPISNIENVRLLENKAQVNGVMEIRQADANPNSIYVIFAQRYTHQATVFYETLDDLRTRRDVATVIRKMESA